MRRPRRRTLTATAAVVVLAVVAIVVAVLVNAPAHVSVSQQFVAGVDEGSSPVALDTSLYEPSSLPAPTVLLAHGFGGTKTDLDSQARDLARRGYQVLTYTARGFGRSGGLIHLDARAYEVADAQRLLDWVIARGGVATSGGKPLVGVAGSSYGGALALMLGSVDRRVSAVAADITWNDLAGVLFPNDVAGASAGSGPFKKLWAGYLFSLGQPVARATTTVPGAFGSAGSVSGQAGCGRFAADFCQLYSQAAETGRMPAGGATLLAQSSPSTFLSQMTAPVLLVQGEQDSLFGLDQSDASERQLTAAGVDVQMRWRSGGHDAPGAGDDVSGWERDFLAGHLRGTRAARSGRFDLAQPDASISSDTGRRIAGSLRADNGYAGVAPTSGRAMALTGAAQRITAPPGGIPAAISSLPSLASLLSTAASLGVSAAVTTIPGQTATFVSSPLADPVLLTGSSRIRLSFQASAPVTAFVSLHDVSADGQDTLPERLVSPIRLAAGSATVDVQLPWIVDRVAAGHRLAVVVTTTDSGYSLPVQSQQIVVSAVSGLTPASVPVTQIRTGSALVPVVIAAVVLVLCLLVLGWRLRRRRPSTGTADPAVPVVITDLVKEYADGYRAVDGVSFRVERGQVVGLLGPNGAGKTTTLRVLMGLITPTTGSIRVFGTEVVPGSPALADLGAFIEGPGFLPHLTGEQNLQLYWRASGRPATAAHFDTVLEIAGLGSSLQRKVKTYSHGMQQRLAIAQAMLGLPEVLILDEPTNGLDPPQIAEMREVLRAYAETGRTVIVSSHLLAEVEQSCTHVVVMHKGRLVAAGSVAEVTGTGHRQLVVEDPDAAAGILRRAGLDVETVPAQRALEDVFLGLIGERP